MSDSYRSKIQIRLKSNLLGSGKHTTKRAERAINYYSLNDDMELQKERGTWYDPEQEITSHHDVIEWAKSGAKEYRNMAQMIMSFETAEPEEALFCELFNEIGKEYGIEADYRLIVHRNTEYCHAHLMWFTDDDKLLPKTEFVDWTNSLKMGMDIAEQFVLEQATELKLEQNASNKFSRQQEWERFDFGL